MRVICIDNTGVPGILTIGKVYPIMKEDYYSLSSKTYALFGLGDMHKSHFKIHPYLFKNKTTGSYMELEDLPNFYNPYPSGVDMKDGELDYEYEKRKELESEIEFYKNWEEVEQKLIGFEYPDGGIVAEANAPVPSEWIRFFTKKGYRPVYKEVIKHKTLNT